MNTQSEHNQNIIKIQKTIFKETNKYTIIYNIDNYN